MSLFLLVLVNLFIKDINKSIKKVNFNLKSSENIYVIYLEFLLVILMMIELFIRFFSENDKKVYLIIILELFFFVLEYNRHRFNFFINVNFILIIFM